jgi:phospholipid/cholesterol/gamma-HCH transport system permease protein
METLVFVGECTQLIGSSAGRLFCRPFEAREILNQMAFIGAASVPIVAMTAFSSGAVIALYSVDIFQTYGAGSLVGGIIALTMIRELAPVLAGIMVAARAGSAMAAQLGSMAVTEQVDALRSLNVHPTNYLVIPRIIGGLTMVPILGLVGIYAGVFGGYVMAVYGSGMSGGLFMQSVRQFVTPHDIQGAMIKTVAFGFIVAVVACQQGLRTKNGAEGVGRATTVTVVVTMVLIYASNFFLAWLIFK